MASFLAVGTKVPAWSTHDSNGNAVSSASAGDKYIIAWFPKANTPGCTVEMKNITEHYDALEAEGYTIYGASCDEQAAQCKFAQKHSLRQTMLCDIDQSVAKTFGVIGTKTSFGRTTEGILRTTFVVEKGVVTHVIDKVTTKDHAAQIYEAIHPGKTMPKPKPAHAAAGDAGSVAAGRPRRSSRVQAAAVESSDADDDDDDDESEEEPVKAPQRRGRAAKKTDEDDGSDEEQPKKKTRGNAKKDDAKSPAKSPAKETKSPAKKPAAKSPAKGRGRKSKSSMDDEEEHQDDQKDDDDDQKMVQIGQVGVEKALVQSAVEEVANEAVEAVIGEAVVQEVLSGAVEDIVKHAVEEVAQEATEAIRKQNVLESNQEVLVDALHKQKQKIEEQEVQNYEHQQLLLQQNDQIKDIQHVQDLAMVAQDEQEARVDAQERLLKDQQAQLDFQQEQIAATHAENEQILRNQQYILDELNAQKNNTVHIAAKVEDAVLVQQELAQQLSQAAPQNQENVQQDNLAQAPLVQSLSAQALILQQSGQVPYQSTSSEDQNAFVQAQGPPSEVQQAQLQLDALENPIEQPYHSTNMADEIYHA